MARLDRDDIARYFDYGIDVPGRVLYMGSVFQDDGSEHGTDYSMAAALKRLRQVEYFKHKGK